MNFIDGTDDDDILNGTNTIGGEISLVSTGSLGQAANGTSQNPNFSPDGTLVAFASKASNLVAGDTNGKWDIFVKNLASGEVTMVSCAQDGTIGNGSSLEPTFSPDGTKVAFSTEASNLLGGDTNGDRELYVKDLNTGEVIRVGTFSDGSEVAGKGFGPYFSPDGTKIVFYSWAALDPTDTNGFRDVYVKDLVSAEVTLISRAEDGSLGDATSANALFSPDGTRIAFMSVASNFAAGDTNDEQDVYIKDLVSGEITLLSKNTAGVCGNGEFGMYYTQINFSPDGNKVVFASEASNLVAGDSNDAPDIFVKDLTTGEVVCVTTNAAGQFGNGDSARWDGTIAFSPDGTKVIFSSSASNLVPNDTNGEPDVFIKDLVTGDVIRVSTDAFGGQANGIAYRPAFSADGTMVVFQNSANNLVAGDNNGYADIFLKIIPTSGNDLISGGLGNDLLLGGSGDDVLIGGADNDSLDGGVGFDTADYRDATAGVTMNLARAKAQDTVGAGIDRLANMEAVSGSSFADTIFGSDGQNTLSGAAGDDLLLGRNGDDVLEGGAGNDQMDGGRGQDIASYAGDTAGVTLDLRASGAQDTGGVGSDTLAHIEDVIATDSDDHITGNRDDNKIMGSAGDDVLIGMKGDDDLIGGVGDDFLVGGAGNDRLAGEAGEGDTVSYATATAAVTLRLFPDHGPQDTVGAGIDTLVEVENSIGSRFDDSLTGGLYENQLDGGAGNDVLSGDTSEDVLIGGLGNDTLYGGVGDDVIDGGRDNDLAYGGLGFDVIDGGTGDDVLNGREDADTIDGGSGNDRVSGGSAADVLRGGSGLDVFIYFELGDSGVNAPTRDRILDFRSGFDKIDLSAIDGIAGVAHSAFTFSAGGLTGVAGQLVVHAHAGGGGFVVSGDVDGNGTADLTIFVAGTTPLTASDFIL